MQILISIARFLRGLPGALWGGLAAAGAVFLLIQRARREASEEASIHAKAKGEKNLVKHLVSQARRTSQAAAAAEKRLSDLSDEAPAEEVQAAVKEAEVATREAQARGADLRKNLFKTLGL